jgi:protein xylosyltransferase
MRTSKISSGNSGYFYIWILAFATSLLLLIALSKSWINDRPSVTASEDFQFPVIVPSKERAGLSSCSCLLDMWY